MVDEFYNLIPSEANRSTLPLFSSASSSLSSSSLFCLKEKTRIAEVAAATLCKLNVLMRQMKDWRDDRARLKSNIWQLKLALRAFGVEPDEELRSQDPFVEHQKNEIARLEMTNGALEDEVTNLRNALAEVEYDGTTQELKNDGIVQGVSRENERLRREITHLRNKLTKAEELKNSSAIQLATGDRVIEIVFTNVVFKVAETISNMSEELVNVSETLHRSRSKNKNLSWRLDRLGAMLRSKNKNTKQEHRRRIADLDELEGRLKEEAGKLVEVEKNDSVIGLKLRHANSTEALRRRLKETEMKMTILAEENRTMKEGAGQSILEFLRGEEDSARLMRLMEMRQIKDEIGTIKGELRELRNDKEEFLTDIDRTRDGIRERDERIDDILLAGTTVENSLNSEIDQLKRVLDTTSNESAKLKRKLDECLEERERLKSELIESKRNLIVAADKIADLSTQLDQVDGDRGRLEAEVVRLASGNEVLGYRLDVETAKVEKTMKELEELTSEYEKLEKTVEEYRTKSSRLTSERSLLQTVMNDKCSTLENRIKAFEIERDFLQNEIGEFRMTSEKLKYELKEKVAMLDRLKSENCEVVGNLKAVTLKNADGEARVRVLLTEKNELTTRINELNEEASTLRDRLNKATTRNDCLASELNELRRENDGATSKGAILQGALELERKNVEELKSEREKSKKEVNQISEKHRMLTDRLNTLENEAKEFKKYHEVLQEENDRLKHCLKKINGRESDENREAVRVEAEETEKSRRVDSKLKIESGKRGVGNGRGKINDKTRNDELRKLQVENEALKFELANLRGENSELRLELSRTEDEFEKPQIELSEDDVIRPNRNELCIRCRKEVNDSANRRSCTKAPGIAKILTRATLCKESEKEIERLRKIIGGRKNVRSCWKVDTLQGIIETAVSVESEEEGLRKEETEKIQALSVELMRLRNERRTLVSQLDASRTELSEVKMEKAALKEELRMLRNTNFDLQSRVGVLQTDYERLKRSNVGLEERLIEDVEGPK